MNSIIVAFMNLFLEGDAKITVEQYSSVVGDTSAKSFETIAGFPVEGSTLAFGAIMLAVLIAVCAFNAIIGIFINHRLFYKAYMPTWAAFVPFYNLYILSKLAFGKGWLFLFLLIPGVGFLFTLVLNWRLSETFGHGFGFFLGLTFFPVIWRAMLAFGKSIYLGPI